MLRTSVPGEQAWPVVGKSGCGAICLPVPWTASSGVLPCHNMVESSCLHSSLEPPLADWGFLPFLPFSSFLPGIISQITICSQGLVAPASGRIQTKHTGCILLLIEHFLEPHQQHLFLILCLGILLACASLPLEARRGQWIPLDELQAIVSC